MPKGANVAVVGATGLVGRTMIQVLEERNFPVNYLRLFAQKSAGTTIKFKGKNYIVENINNVLNTFTGYDIALFSAGSEASKYWAPIAQKSGCYVIDNSNAWRIKPEIPLIVPEVNPADIEGAIHPNTKGGIIANPNCSTIQMVVALYPIHLHAHINKIDVVTYQSVSGAGQKALDKLKLGSKEFDIIPQIGKFLRNGNCEEEQKMIRETRKIMGLPFATPISATTVRVPIERGHSEVIKINTLINCEISEIESILKSTHGVKVINPYPTVSDAINNDEVLVGRIRKDEIFAHNGISMWVVADNIRKGAATNAVQIAEILWNEYLN